MKQDLTVLQGKVNRSIITAEDVNTFSLIGIPSKYKIHNIEQLDYKINELI